MTIAPPMRAALLAALLIPAAALAQQTPSTPAMAMQPACPATPAPLPAMLAGWATMRPITAASRAAELTLATVRPGEAVRAALVPADTVRFALAPKRADDAAGHAGLLAVTITEAGRYRIALGGGVWVDVIKDGAALTSVAHDHGPACSGVRKMVDFDLGPGRYVIQLAGSKTPSVGVMVVRVPA